VNETVAQLVALSRSLGRPERDLVVLAEGNTSVALGDGTFLVKSSGARLESVSANDCIRLRLPPLLEAVVDGGAADAGELFAAARVATSPGDGRPSIETFVHVAALGVAGARWVAHTHPTALTALLCSPDGTEALLAGPLFPDEAVVCGPVPLYVPYAEPGLELGRAVALALREHVSAHGHPPRTILLENHGLVALGESAAEVEAVTTMAAKAARLRAAALAAGRIRPLAAASVAELGARADERERRARLAGDRP
jgi:rhamnose utilization protein RhaD (predicted bifunctional aldolase and dehydrogenase)